VGQVTEPEPPKPKEEVTKSEPHSQPTGLIPDGLKDQAGAILQSGFVQNLIEQAVGQATKSDSPSTKEAPKSLIQNDFVKSMVAGLFTEAPSHLDQSDCRIDVPLARGEMTIDELEANILSSCIIQSDESVPAADVAAAGIKSTGIEALAAAVSEELRASGIPEDIFDQVIESGATIDRDFDQLFDDPGSAETRIRTPVLELHTDPEFQSFVEPSGDAAVANVEPATGRTETYLDGVACVTEILPIDAVLPSTEGSLNPLAAEDISLVLEQAAKAVGYVSRELEELGFSMEESAPPESQILTEFPIKIKVEEIPNLQIPDTQIPDLQIPAEELMSIESRMETEDETLPILQIPVEEEPINMASQIKADVEALPDLQNQNEELDITQIRNEVETEALEEIQIPVEQTESSELQGPAGNPNVEPKSLSDTLMPVEDPTAAQHQINAEAEGIVDPQIPVQEPTATELRVVMDVEALPDLQIPAVESTTTTNQLEKESEASPDTQTPMEVPAANLIEEDVETIPDLRIMTELSATTKNQNEVESETDPDTQNPVEEPAVIECRIMGDVEALPASQMLPEELITADSETQASVEESAGPECQISTTLSDVYESDAVPLESEASLQYAAVESSSLEPQTVTEVAGATYILTEEQSRPDAPVESIVECDKSTDQAVGDVITDSGSISGDEKRNDSLLNENASGSGSADPLNLGKSPDDDVAPRHWFSDVSFPLTPPPVTQSLAIRFSFLSSYCF